MPKKYKVVKQKLKSTSGEFFIYRFLSMKCRSAYNRALANIKKHYQEENKYINKFDNFTELQNNELSIWLNNEIYQKAVFRADASYQAYFKLLEYQKKNLLKETDKGILNTLFPFSYLLPIYENVIGK
ncbi:MAG: hypothetical protein K6B64_05895 [Acholeplasmatales bacterium]|nr:hypothetical protein [Acholeplasmatales bacterium]